MHFYSTVCPTFAPCPEGGLYYYLFSMLRNRLLLVVLMLVSVAGYAQKVKYGSIKGKLVNTSTKTPFDDLYVSIPSLKAFTISTNGGNFSIKEVPYGSYDVVINGEQAVSTTVHINVNKDIVDAGTIEVAQSASKNEVDNQIPTIAVEDVDNISDDDNNQQQNMMGYFTPAQDQFLFNMYRTFGYFRFRPRGFNQSENFFNGINIADLATGRSFFSMFGGLNDVLRSRSMSYGLKPSDYSFGVMNGSVNYIDATAASQRAGTTVSYFASNRTFRNRVMITHNSGILKNGWSYSVSVSKRWAKEGYYDGTFYDGYSYYAAVSKNMKKGTLSLSTIGAPTYRGLVSTALQETYDLTNNHYYNPSWGKYNDGKNEYMRSMRTSDVFQPLTVLNYTHMPNDRTKWNTSLGFQSGTNKRGGVDFYNGYNPAPDYYRNLPSYYIYGITTPNPKVAADLTALYQGNPDLLQVDWDRMYQANYMNYRTIENANGSGSAVSGKQSIYVVSSMVDKMTKLSFNSTVDHAVNEHFNVQGGLNVTSQSDEYYKQMDDLMGGDFYVNFNQFAAQASPGNANVVQNNLDIPNQIIKKGDKYGYDYILNVLQAQLWAQGVYTLDKFNFFVAANGTNTSFDRDGKIRSGLYPNESYGKSDKHNFMTFGAKGGVRFQPDAHNILFANAGYQQYAPNVHNTFISERTRNTAINNPKVSVTKSAEVGYQYKTTRIVGTLTGYVSDITDAVDILRFFNDDPDVQSYVNYVMQDQGKRSIGFEASLSYKINESFSANANASVGQVFYTNRPLVSIYQDNNAAASVTSKQVYINNYYIGSGPQSVYTAGVTYRPNSSMRFGINVNYLDRNYVSINPERRTALAVDMVEPGSTQWKAITEQEKLPAATTVDVNGSKTWNTSKWTRKALHKGSSLVLNAGINNLLNNQDIKVVGYEQLRFDYKNQVAMKFPNKYTYAMGINFFASLSLRF